MKLCEKCCAEMEENAESCPNCLKNEASAENLEVASEETNTSPTPEGTPSPESPPVATPEHTPQAPEEPKPAATNMKPEEVIGVIFWLVVLACGLYLEFHLKPISEVKNASFPGTTITHCETFFDEILFNPTWTVEKGYSKESFITVTGLSMLYQEWMGFTFRNNDGQISLFSVERADGTIVPGILGEVILNMHGA